jgi:hypothetical protein
MKLITRAQRVILDAATKACVIRGTLTAPGGASRDFHGWLQPTQPGARFRFSTQNPAVSRPQTDARHRNQKDPQMPSLTEPDSALSQLDRELRELTREHGHVFELEEFRCDLDKHEQVLMARHVAPPPPPRAQGDPEAASEADRMRQLRAAIDRRLQRGDSLDTLERELIAPSGLPEEQQDALWVYAWSQPKRAPIRPPRLSVWAALGNALLTLVGIYRY